MLDDFHLPHTRCIRQPALAGSPGQGSLLHCAPYYLIADKRFLRSGASVSLQGNEPDEQLILSFRLRNCGSQEVSRPSSPKRPEKAEVVMLKSLHCRHGAKFVVLETGNPLTLVETLHITVKTFASPGRQPSLDDGLLGQFSELGCDL